MSSREYWPGALHEWLVLQPPQSKAGSVWKLTEAEPIPTSHEIPKGESVDGWMGGWRGPSGLPSLAMPQAQSQRPPESKVPPRQHRNGIPAWSCVLGREGRQVPQPALHSCDCPQPSCAPPTWNGTPWRNNQLCTGLLIKKTNWIPWLPACKQGLAKHLQPSLDGQQLLCSFLSHSASEIMTQVTV